MKPKHQISRYGQKIRRQFAQKLANMHKPEVHDYHSGYVQKNIKEMKKLEKKRGYFHKEMN